MVTAQSLCNANDNDNWSHRTQTSAAPLHRVRRYVHLSWLQLVGSRERERAERRREIGAAADT